MLLVVALVDRMKICEQVDGGGRSRRRGGPAEGLGEVGGGHAQPAGATWLVEGLAVPRCAFAVGYEFA